MNTTPYKGKKEMHIGVIQLIFHTFTKGIVQ